MTVADPFSHPFRVADLAAKKPTRFALTPDSATRADLAAFLGILGVDALEFRGEVRPVGRRDWELEGKLSARVVQPCIVTLAPVTTAIEEHILRRYVADLPDPEGDEIEMPEDDTVEPLQSVIDAGQVATEALALALPLYPRAMNADAALPEPEAPEKPFANLAALLQKKGEGEGT